MTRLLVYAINHDTEDKLCLQQGHVVAIKPDGHVWGKEECLPTFYQVDLPGMEKKDLEYLMEGETKPETSFYMEGSETKSITNNVPVSIRLNKMDINILDIGKAAILGTTGKITIDKDQVSKVFVAENLEKIIVKGGVE